jgi:hypothetical protein
MICSHFFRSQAKLVLVVPSMRARARSPSMTRPAQDGPLQPFCGALISTSTPVARMSTHIAPEAMQSSTNRPSTRAPPRHGAQVVVGQACRRRFRHAARKPRPGARGSRPPPRRSAPGERRLRAFADAAGLEHRGRRRDPAHVEDLRPAEAEPAVAQHQAPSRPPANWRATASMAKVPPPGTTATASAGRPLQVAGDVAHDALEGLRHVVERAVGIDHRIFEQAVGIDVGQQAGHHLLQSGNAGNPDDSKRCRGRRRRRAASSAR